MGCMQEMKVGVCNQAKIKYGVRKTNIGQNMQVMPLNTNKVK